MPNRGSWNGGWSGEKNFYAIVRTFSSKSRFAKETLPGLIAQKNFYYRWSDGWGANVELKAIDAKEARQVNKTTKGFCGYDWMVDSIISHGKIYATHEVPKADPNSIGITATEPLDNP